MTPAVKRKRRGAGSQPSKRDRPSDEVMEVDQDGAQSSSFSPARCLRWFSQYRDAGSEAIEAAGITRFCEELGVPPDDIIVLLLAYLMQARTMGVFTWEEWLRGMEQLRCDSVSALRAQLPQLHARLRDAETFRAMYRFAFDFARDENQRSLDIPTASAMLEVVLSGRSAHTSDFIFFLREVKPVKVINRDQWTNFYEFSQTIHRDLSNYDETAAWPVLFDDYVTWKKQQASTHASPVDIMS